MLHLGCGAGERALSPIPAPSKMLTVDDINHVKFRLEAEQIMRIRMDLGKVPSDLSTTFDIDENSVATNHRLQPSSDLVRMNLKFGWSIRSTIFGASKDMLSRGKRKDLCRWNSRRWAGENDGILGLDFDARHRNGRELRDAGYRGWTKLKDADHRDSSVLTSRKLASV